MTYPSLSQIGLGFEILGQEHHIETSQIPARLARNTQLNPQQRAEAASALTWLASLVDGGNLARVDFRLALSQQALLHDHHEAAYNPSIEAALREGLGLPSQDPLDIRLHFSSVERAGNQYSWVSIIPQELDFHKPVLIFVTGLHHPSPIYLAHMMELARQEHRVIHVVDLPSMGGSVLAEDASVYASDLNQAVLTCIEETLLLGQGFDLMAHSLGTVPARDIENEALANEQRSYQGRILNRVVLVAPVPSQEDRELGYRIRSSFTWSAIGTLMAYGAIDPERVNELFVQNHPTNEQEWLNQVVGRERFSSSLAGTLSVFLNNYSHPFAGRLGKDPHLRVVLPAEDRLIQVSHSEDWRNHRGVLWVEGADHSFIGGQRVNPAYIQLLREALNGNLNVHQEAFNRSAAFRHLRSTSYAGMSVNSRASLGGQLYLGARQGLAVMGPLAWDVELGLQNFIGGDSGHFDMNASEYERNRHFTWRPQGNLNLGISLLHTLPLRVIAGAYVEADPITSIRQEGLYGGAGFLGGIEVNFEDTILLRTQYQHPLWEAQGRPLPDFGEIWVNLGARLF